MFRSPLRAFFMGRFYDFLCAAAEILPSDGFSELGASTVSLCGFSLLSLATPWAS